MARRLRESHAHGFPAKTEQTPAVLRWINEPVDSVVARFGGQAGIHLAQSGGQPFRFRVRYEYDAYGHLQRVVNHDNVAEVFWQATAMNAAGQVTGVQYGNGLSSSRLYDQVTGLVKQIDTGSVQSLRYHWDAVGNLEYRQDQLQGLSESFQYDALNRLHTVSGPSPMSITYDPHGLGNIQSKTGVGTYTYHPQRPHQVTSTTSGGSYAYDANGNMTSRNGATLTWTSYNLPSSLSSGGNSASFSYGPSRNRFRQIAIAGGVTTETVYVAGGQYERITTAGTSEHRHYVKAGGETVAVHTRRSNYQHETRYLHADHLGSVESITDEQGTLLARLSFDAFGKRRGSNCTGNPSSGEQTVIGSTTSRGFTFHEMLDDIGLVHMNGRVYDPHLGRFLSADPFVPAPYNLQSYNRYSYVLNNPLSYTDPSGHFFVKKAFKSVARVVRSGARFIRSNWRPIVAIGLSAWAGGTMAASLKAAGASAGTISAMGGAVTGGTFGASNTVLAGGNFGDVVHNSLMGFTAGAVGGGISARFGGATLTSRTLSGGIGGAVQTGNWQGFVRGMVGGIIPNNVLPHWQGAYESNAWAHTLLSVASDGLRGAVIGGRDGARFAMSWGLANNAVGHTFGFLASGAKPNFEGGAWHYHAPTLPGTPAIALGNVVSWNEAYYKGNAPLRQTDFAHETIGHVQIQGAMNVAYLPVHAISQWLMRGLGGRLFMEYAPFIGEHPYPERN